VVIVLPYSPCDKVRGARRKGEHRQRNWPAAIAFEYVSRSGASSFSKPGIDDRQHAVRTQAGLDRVDQEQRAVRLRELARAA
jgi:hypothetical protein